MKYIVDIKDNEDGIVRTEWDDLQLALAHVEDEIKTNEYVQEVTFHLVIDSIPGLPS